MIQPTILLTRGAVLDTFRLVGEYPHIETSWGGAGIVFPEVDNFALITNIILPSSKEVSRGFSVTTIGGSHLATCVAWLQKQYPLIRPMAGNSPAFYANTEYMFFSKGHSHHVLGLKQQSRTDEQSTMESVTVDGLSIAIAPLANIVSNPDEEISTNLFESCLSIRRNLKIELRLYFYNRTMANLRMPRPILVTPTVIDDVYAPKVPMTSWHLDSQGEYLSQIRQLATYGCRTKTINKVNSTNNGLNLQLMIEHPMWSGVLMITTSDTYPNTRPDLKIVDLKKPTGLRVQYHQENPKLKVGDVWSRGDTLLDIVMKHEARGLL